jgi:anaphase-promoting complex subunit 2
MTSIIAQQLCSLSDILDGYDTSPSGSVGGNMGIVQSQILPAHGSKLKAIVCRVLKTAMKSYSNQSSLKNSSDIRLIRLFGLAFIFENDVISVLKDGLDQYARQKHKGMFTAPVLDDIMKWASSSLMNFVSKCFEGGVPSNIEKELLWHAHISLAMIRSCELFDIVADFPDSTPAIIELNNLVGIPGVLGSLGTRLKKTLLRRLLHSGAATSQIIDFYVAMIRAFRLLDPSNILLNYCATPIRKYLVSRKDTIRCIVSSLTEGRDNLKNELRVGGSLEFGMDSDDDTETTPECLWSPPKRALDFPGGSGSQEKDIIALLVSIYGSTDLFVNEYRSMLADRLLNNLDYNIDNEVTTLELLKIR